MKLIDVALKDLSRVFRNPFSLIMMIGAPFLITGLLYFAFGQAVSEGELELQAIPLAIANLDQDGIGLAGGETLAELLESEDPGDLLQVDRMSDEAEARAAVDTGRVAAALIIPADFSAALMQPQGRAEVVLYQDPTLSIGPAIVRDLIHGIVDGFAGVKIASQVVEHQFIGRGLRPDASAMEAAAQSYSAWLQPAPGQREQASGGRDFLRIVSLAGEPSAGSQAQTLIAPVMAGMMIFFVFFMAATGAESIVRESEEGTLARLFTTPTPRGVILGGTLLAVVVGLAIQVTVLLGASAGLFHIRWGAPLPMLLAGAGLVLQSAGFGVFLMSFIRTTRQTGPVMGGVMTVTGMLGGLFTTGISGLPKAFEIVNLTMPQGWAMRGWKLVLSEAPVNEILGTTAVMFGIGGVMFAVGVLLLRRRFA